jgi:hypothetical protein
MPDDPAILAAFGRLFERALETGPGTAIDYDLPYPRWQFLCYMADTREVLLHGSGNDAIARFEPRKADDVSSFGDRQAVYAASDGLWPVYYAILDRANHPMSLINSAVRLVDEDGAVGEPLYFFSISAKALVSRPYRRGTIYVLPRAGFEQQQGVSFHRRRVLLPQWASLQPVTPLMKLSIGPEDFPLLDHIRGHDDESTFARARADPDGFPWLD